MIIACPECTSPFQVLDGQIAALVQIECPTCTFRMILDFAAANDASLREAGMGMAQGFRDETSYRQAVGAGEVTYSPEARPAAHKPDLRAVPEPEPEHRPASTPAPTPTPVQPQAQPQAEPQAEPPRGKPPVRARPTLIAHTAPPPVRPELTPPPQRVIEARAEAAVDTHVGPPPRSEPEIAAPIEVSEPADSAQLEVAGDEFSVDLDEPDSEPEAVPAPRPRPAVEAEPTRTPPHSPSPPPSSTKTPEDEPADVPAVERKPEAAKPAETGKRKGGALRTVLLMFLLLVLMGAAGLMGWSVIETQNPNPLPMLKAKFGIDLGFGVPADAGEAGDEKVDPPPAGGAPQPNANGQ